jgi:hypothetical protein
MTTHPSRPRRAGLALATVPLLAASLGLAVVAPASAEAATEPSSAARAIRSTELVVPATTIPAEGVLVVQVKASGTGEIPGTVTISTDDGQLEQSRTLSDRTATFKLRPGSYPGLNVTYSGAFGGDTYLPAIGQADVTVARATLTHTTDLIQGQVLDQFAPHALGVTPVSSEPTLTPYGHYTLLAFDQDDRRTTFSEGEFNGSGQLAFDTSAITQVPGTYRIFFQSTREDWFEAKDTLLGTVTVVPARIPTTTGIQVPNGPAPYGSGAARVVGQVNPREAGGAIDGTLQVLVDGKAYGEKVPVDSTDPVSIVLPTLAPGSYTVKVAYSGGTAYAGDDSDSATLVIGKARSLTSIGTPRVTQGGLVSLQVGAQDSVAAGSGTVTVSEGDRVLGTTTVTGGQGSFRLPADLAPGVHTLVASYAGSTTHTASTSQPTAVTVVAPAPSPVPSRITGTASRSGRTVTVRATVASGKPVTGRVQVLDGRRVVRTISLAASARGRVTTTLRGLTPGRHAITVRYLGSSTVRASSRTFRVTVPRR